MFRKELPRLYELRDQIQDPLSPNAYFRDFDNRARDFAPMLKQFRDIEAELGGLDSVSWSYLKTELVPLLTKKDAKRGWRALFDRINEAKGYNYLAIFGCTDIEFIPRSPKQGEPTPDLRGSLGHIKVLCEVKTIGISQVEAARRNDGSVGTILAELEDGFFNKLTATLETARRQMVTFCPDPGTKRIAYVIVDFDDSLHEYAQEYSKQIATFIATQPVPGLDIVFDIKPPFYSAMA